MSGNDDSSSRRSDPGTDQDDAIDLAALRADDDLIEALAAGLLRGSDQPERHGSDAELVAMLEAWVADVRPETVVGRVGTAVAAPPSTEARPLRPAHARAPLWSRYGRHLAAAAAFVVLASSGLALGAADAVPGETLWEVSKVFYAERARSVEAAAEVSVSLEKARTALLAGRPAEAAQAIQAVSAQLDIIRPAEGHDALALQHDQLIAAIADPSLISELSPLEPAAAPDVALAAPEPSSRPSPLIPTDDAVVPNPSSPDPAQPAPTPAAESPAPPSPAPSDPPPPSDATPSEPPPPTDPAPGNPPPSDPAPGNPPPSNPAPSNPPPSNPAPSNPPPSNPAPSNPAPGNPPPSNPAPGNPPPSGSNYGTPPAEPPPAEPPPAELPALEAGVITAPPPPASESQPAVSDAVAPASTDAMEPVLTDSGPTEPVTGQTAPEQPAPDQPTPEQSADQSGADQQVRDQPGQPETPQAPTEPPANDPAPEVGNSTTGHAPPTTETTEQTETTDTPEPVASTTPTDSSPAEPITPPPRDSGQDTQPTVDESGDPAPPTDSTTDSGTTDSGTSDSGTSDSSTTDSASISS